jgi:glyoxylate reductase
MSKPIIALSRPMPDAFKQLMGSLGEIALRENNHYPENASIYITTPMDATDSTVITALPDTVKLIASMGVGTDHIDLAAAKSRGIAVTNTPVVTEDTADLCWALLMATMRGLTRNEKLLRAGAWDGMLPGAMMGSRVYGKTLGIIGFGAIGQAVARRAKGFGMPIIYSGPNRKLAAEQELSASYCESVQQLVCQADVVSLHCPLTDGSHHLINAGMLAKFKVGSTLINTGRGPLIDEAALVTALQEGPLSCAGLDVFEFEPKVTEDLLELSNVTLLPHLGSATNECRTDIVMRLYENIQQFQQAGAGKDPVLG